MRHLFMIKHMEQADVASLHIAFVAASYIQVERVRGLGISLL